MEAIRYCFMSHPRGSRKAVQEIAPEARIDPRSVCRGDVIVCQGARIAANCQIVGPTVIGPHAQVGPGSVLSGVCLWPNATLQAESRLADLVVVGEEILPSSGGFNSDFADALAIESAGGAKRRIAHGVKRSADVFLSLIGLLLLSPLLAAVAVLIKTTSPGPIFFGHEREGQRGQPFRCWKFRTMVNNAHAGQRDLYSRNNVDGPQFKLKDDPRVTAIGSFLRRTNLDELPQLFNVLRGEMSLIGPRPSPFRENQLCMPWREARLAVKPGITGLWQVCRHDRGNGDFYQWIYFDNLYVQHQSVLLDLSILLVTIMTFGGCWPVPVEWLIPSKRWNGNAIRGHVEGA